MARSFGQIYAGMWRDDDFQALTADAQLAYIMLSTQADISSCGLLSMTLGRWAKYTTGMTKDRLSDALSELAAARFIVVDDDTEEVLVRTFVKWDGGANNGKRRPAILAAAHAIASPMLKGIVGAELTKLDVQHDLPHSASNSPLHGVSDSPRVLVTERNHSGLNPEPVTLNPEPASGATAPQPPTPTVNQRAQQMATAYTDQVPLSKFPAILGIAKKAIQSNRYTDEQITAGLLRLAAEGRSVTVEALRIELDGQPPSASRPPRDKFQEGIALAERMLRQQDRQTAAPRQIGA